MSAGYCCPEASEGVKCDCGTEKATKLLATVVCRWDLGVDRWRQNHPTIPSAFIELACTIDEIKRELRGEK